MDKQKIIDILNKDRADELGAIMQYMDHYYNAKGLDSAEIREEFKDTSIDEMKHAEKLAERIVYLGGAPVMKPSAFKTGGGLRTMIQDDLDAENAAIAQYKEHIKICDEEGDSTTRLMLEGILTEEEEHADSWEKLLGI